MRLQEQLRIVSEARRMEGVTFVPDLSPTRATSASRPFREVPARLPFGDSAALGAYLESVAHKRREAAAVAEAAARQREVHIRACR